MTFRDGWGANTWTMFWHARQAIMRECGRYGDQKAIENLVPDAAILQEYLPAGFLLNKRDFEPGGPGKASVAIFGGKERPHVSRHAWVKEHWR